MDISLLIQMALDWLVANVPYAVLGLTVLGGLVVVGQAIVAVTPSQSDDAWLEKLKQHKILGPILVLLAKFAPFQKK